MKKPTVLLLLHLLFFFSVHQTSHGSSAKLKVNVGVVLDFETLVGKTSNATIKMAVDDFYAAHPEYTTRVDLLVQDTKGDVITAAAAVVDFIRNRGVQAIIGPQSSGEAEFAADLADKSRVPMLSFSVTSPTVSHDVNRYFVRTAVSDSTQAKAIADLIKTFDWHQVVPIYEDTEYGTGVIPILIDAIKDVGGKIPYRCILPPSATDDQIEAKLRELMSMQTRVFVVHMRRSLATRLFSIAATIDMMGKGYAWIMTNGLTSTMGTVASPAVFESMEGVLGVRPYIRSTDRLKDFRKRWRRRAYLMEEETDSVEITDVSSYGLWAYDTVWALAMAVEKVKLSLSSSPSPRPMPGPNDLAQLPVSTNGPELLEAILSTNFKGLSGDFRLTHGQLNCTVFEIINIVGEKEMTVGFWTAAHGLSQPPRRRDSNQSSPGLKSIIWPGDTPAVPKGWVTPMEGKRLKILVPGPVAPGFQSFLKADRRNDTDEIEVGGFVMEVFEAAVNELPYAILWEYAQMPDKKSGGKYDNLVYQVFLQTYDALVGDVTITANRSNYVDFTLPYMTSGVSMVVPKIDRREKDMFIFTRPMTGNMWVVSGAFFVFIGIVVWIIEHPINPEFRGEPTNQIGTVVYFASSTLVFAHREKMLSILSRIALVVWLFVVLILQSSYTASLTSMLTVEQLRPTVAEIDDLKMSNEYIGYLKDSFVKGLLIGMGFEERRLRPYHSPQEYAEALAKGSKNGGVGAIIDEIPYLRVFLKDYCSNYTMSGRTLKAGGFGFVFPKGSPLVPDLSRAILNITEGDKMLDIEKRWFGDQTSCVDRDNPLSSNSLDFSSFCGLFLITGAASGLTFIIFVIQFLYAKRHHLKGEGSLTKRMKTLAREFDQKDLSHRSFHPSPVSTRHSMPSPTTTGSRSSFSISHRTHGEGTLPRTNRRHVDGSETPISFSNRLSGYETPPTDSSLHTVTMATHQSQGGGSPPPEMELAPIPSHSQGGGTPPPEIELAHIPSHDQGGESPPPEIDLAPPRSRTQTQPSEIETPKFERRTTS